MQYTALSTRIRSDAVATTQQSAAGVRILHGSVIPLHCDGVNVNFAPVELGVAHTLRTLRLRVCGTVQVRIARPVVVGLPGSGCAKIA